MSCIRLVNIAGDAVLTSVGLAQARPNYLDDVRVRTSMGRGCFNTAGSSMAIIHHGLDLVSLATEYLNSDPDVAQHHLERLKGCVPVLITQLKEYEKARVEQRDHLLEKEKNLKKQIGHKEQEMDRLRLQITEWETRKSMYDVQLENASRALSQAQDKRRRVEDSKSTAVGTAVGMGVGAIFLGVIFPPSLVFTVPTVAASATIAIVEAEKEIDRSNAKVLEAKCNIRIEKTRIVAANDTISSIKREILDLSTRRNDLHKELKEMWDNIVFLQKAATFLGKLAVTVKGGENLSTLLHTIVKEANKHQEYKILRSSGCTIVAKSFAAAWKEVEKEVSAGENMSFINCACIASY